MSANARVAKQDRNKNSAGTAPLNSLIQLLRTDLSDRIAKNPRYSLRAYSKFLGTSASTLSRVLSDQLRPTPDFFEKVVARLGLNAADFQDSIHAHPANQTPSPGYDEVFTRLPSSDADLVSDWRCMAVLELIKKVPGLSLKVIANNLNISRHEVRDAVGRLTTVGLIKSSGQVELGKSKANETYIAIGDHSFFPSGPSSLRLRQLQIDLLTKSMAAIQMVPFDLRHHASLVFTLPLGRLDEFHDLLTDFRIKVNALSAQSSTTGPKTDTPDQTKDPFAVYCLNLGLFPLGQTTSQEISTASESEAPDR